MVINHFLNRMILQVEVMSLLFGGVFKNITFLGAENSGCIHLFFEMFFSGEHVGKPRWPMAEFWCLKPDGHDAFFYEPGGFDSILNHLHFHHQDFLA